MAAFGVLKRLDPRDIWAKEAFDFTPWLADNLDALGEALGTELQLTEKEAPVGAFALDILARDLSGRVVVIENQLEQTDHDHLGKLLTYAAGHDASIVVWIARELREEHRQAIDWLNQHTGEELNFFGIVVEVFRIDDSRPAYTFKPVAFPNHWRKAVVSGESSPKEKSYQAFFQTVIDELRDRHKFTRARVAQPQSWYAFSSGFSGIPYGLSFAQGGKVRVDVYLDSGEAHENKAVFDRLIEERESIEAEFGARLVWERLPERRASRVAIYRTGRIEDKESHGELRQWGIKNLMRFREIFGPRLSAVLQAQTDGSLARAGEPLDGPGPCGVTGG